MAKQRFQCGTLHFQVKAFKAFFFDDLYHGERSCGSHARERGKVGVLSSFHVHVQFCLRPKPINVARWARHGAADWRTLTCLIYIYGLFFSHELMLLKATWSTDDINIVLSA